MIGLENIRKGIDHVSYDLKYIDLKQKTLQTIDNPFGTRLSPMSQVKRGTYMSGMDKGISLVAGAGFEPAAFRL